MSWVRARAVRWISDEPIPGWVEVHLDLADGTIAALFDKPPIFESGNDLRASSPYPVTVALECAVTASEPGAADDESVQVTLRHATDPSGNAVFLVRRTDVSDQPASAAGKSSQTAKPRARQTSTSGDEPLANGMQIAVRIRHDFTVTDADRLLAAARRSYLELNPQASEADAAAAVTSAADAIFMILEHDGLIGDPPARGHADRQPDGLQPAGWRAQVTIGDPDPLPAGPDCLNADRDVFALPRSDR